MDNSDITREKRKQLAKYEKDLKSDSKKKRIMAKLNFLDINKRLK